MTDRCHPCAPASLDICNRSDVCAECRVIVENLLDARIGGRKQYIHTVVAEAWHGPRPGGLLVLHQDDDPMNPTPTNLRYGTELENARDRRRNRRQAKTTGTAPAEEGTTRT